MSLNKTNSGETEGLGFAQKVWLTCGIVALAITLLWILKASINVLLLIFAGSLIAVFFNKLSGLIQQKFRLSPKFSLATSIIGTILIILLLFWFIGAKIQQQIAELTKTLPATVENAKQQLNQSAIGSRILQAANSGAGEMTGFAKRFFTTSFGVLGDLYVVLFIGIFFTISPWLYINGVIALIPRKGQQKAKEVFVKAGVTLGNWLKGQIIAMAVVAVLTGIGLSILGVPMALALALIAGILNFIPNFGPLIAMIPAVLVGFMQGPTTALIIAGIYLLIQALESNLITPTVQKRLINMPPALILIGQLFMSTLTGAWGIVLATPIVALVMVAVKELYVDKK